MNFKFGKKITAGYSWRRLLYTICFLLFCIIDQRIKTASGLDGIIESFRDSLGIVVAVLIISHYKWEDFVKWKQCYIVWGILSIVGAVNAFSWGIGQRPFLNDWIVVLADVVIWGFIIIHTFISVVLEKKYPALNKKLLMAWGIMMLLMVISRSAYIWPLCYTLIFGCFYLTDFTKEEQNDLLQGGLDGIILAFILFQGFCCVFRPYDVARYTGIHNNCNLNAIYYLAVLAAVFVKIIYLTKNQSAKWLRGAFWLLAGVVYSFLFMTIGRIAWITSFVLGLLFLAYLNQTLQKKQFIRNGLILVLCAILMFPITFGAVRYIPPVFHHPIWFWGEWSADRVHSWDAWNSEKYMDMDELLEEALGRVVLSVQTLLEHSPFAIKAEAMEQIPDDDPRALAEVLPEENWGDDFLIRGTIYKYYFTHLNWRGHPYEEQGFQLTRYYWIGHAHNIFLQYGTDFGIPVMVLFAVFVAWSCAICWKRSKERDSIADMAAVFYILIPVVFGLFEYSWGVSSLSITMLFIAWRQALNTNE